MKQLLRPMPLLAAALLAAACREAPITGPGTTRLPRALTAGEQRLVAADNAFAFKLYGALAAEDGPDSNIFISPLSVGMALGMTVNGAAGATRDSMLAALQLAGAADGRGEPELPQRDRPAPGARSRRRVHARQLHLVPQHVPGARRRLPRRHAHLLRRAGPGARLLVAHRGEDDQRLGEPADAGQDPRRSWGIRSTPPW